MSTAKPPFVQRRKPEPAPAAPTVIVPNPPSPPLPDRKVPAACCQAYAAELKQRRQERHAKKSEQRAERKAESCGRLPDGSAFHVTYDATAQKWSGSLVTTVNGQQANFTASAEAVFKLLAKLDGLYRSELARDAAEEAEAFIAEQRK